MRPPRRSFPLASMVAGIVAIVACGSRTGLLYVPPDAVDASLPLEAGSPPEVGPPPQDAPVEVDACTSPPACSPDDPGSIYQCGKPIQHCGSLEQCEDREIGGTMQAACVNPCRDTLGNDTSNGCEFYAVEMDTTNQAVGVCYAV